LWKLHKQDLRKWQTNSGSPAAAVNRFIHWLCMNIDQEFASKYQRITIQNVLDKQNLSLVQTLQC
jgi:hypothetical protein